MKEIETPWTFTDFIIFAVFSISSMVVGYFFESWWLSIIMFLPYFLGGISGTYHASRKIVTGYYDINHVETMKAFRIVGVHNGELKDNYYFVVRFAEKVPYLLCVPKKSFGEITPEVDKCYYLKRGKFIEYKN